MILRSWRGRALAADADEYLAFLRAVVLPEMEAHGGRGAYVTRRDEGAEAEFWVLSLWESMGAVRRFAGPVPERAVVPAGARRLLVDYDPEVQHYEILDAPGTAPFDENPADGIGLQRDEEREDPAEPTGRRTA